MPDGNPWYLRNYLIRLANPIPENIDIQRHNAHLARLVNEMDTACLSPDFDYLRVGFIVGNLGKRGICVSIWHWGKWGATHEMFNQCWYTYNRDYDLLKPLSHDEPVCCEFEMPILLKELSCFQQAVAEGFDGTTKRKFREYVVQL